MEIETNTPNIEIEGSKSEIDIEIEVPVMEIEPIAPELEIEVGGSVVKDDYEKFKNLPSINGVVLKGNKTTEELGIVGTSMTEIEVSTNPEEPTDISIYFDKSGTYVAKNTGVISFDGILTPIAKGGFFTIQNFKDDASKLGVEVPDEDNILMVSLFVYNGEIIEEVLLKRIGIDDWYASVKITSENASDYLDLDIDVTSEVAQALSNAINSNYGMQLISNRYVSFINASNSEIDSSNTPYRVITPNNVGYAIQKKGANYFPTKEEHETLENDLTTLENDLTTLETNVNTLKSEIETILESVVSIDE